MTRNSAVVCYGENGPSNIACASAAMLWLQLHSEPDIY